MSHATSCDLVRKRADSLGARAILQNNDGRAASHRLFLLTQDLVSACANLSGWVSEETRRAAEATLHQILPYTDWTADVLANRQADGWTSHPDLDFRFLRWRNEFLLGLLRVPTSVYEPVSRE